MTDIAEQLRTYAVSNGDGELMLAGADEIERLRQRVVELEVAAWTPPINVKVRAGDTVERINMLHSGGQMVTETFAHPVVVMVDEVVTLDELRRRGGNAPQSPSSSPVAAAVVGSRSDEFFLP